MRELGDRIVPNICLSQSGASIRSLIRGRRRHEPETFGECQIEVLKEEMETIEMCGYMYMFSIRTC